jgi:hypothetical protein
MPRRISKVRKPMVDVAEFKSTPGTVGGVRNPEYKIRKRELYAIYRKQKAEEKKRWKEEDKLIAKAKKLLKEEEKQTKPAAGMAQNQAKLDPSVQEAGKGIADTVFCA